MVITAAAARPVARSARLPRLRASGLAHVLADGLDARKGGRRLTHLPLRRDETRYRGWAIPDDQSGPYRIDKHTWLWQRLFPIDDAMVQVRRICPGCYDQSLVQIDQGPRDPQDLQESVQATAAVLVGLEREVRLNGGRLAVAVLPTRFQVEPDLAGPDYRKVAALLGLGEGDLGYDDEVVRGLLAELDAAGVPTVPLQEALRAARKGGAFYYSRDWHLNPAGHRAAAAALEQALLSLGVLAIGGR